MKEICFVPPAKVIFFILVLFLAKGFADTSALCNDLVSFSCAPGSYKDGTGKIRSESEVSRFISAYVEKSRISLRDKFDRLLNKRSNSYFKDLAVAGLGLKNSPQCTSSQPDDISVCRQNLVDSLTTLAQKQVLGSLMPQTGIERKGNLIELSYITQDQTYQSVIETMDDQFQKDFSHLEMSQKIQKKIFPKIKELIIARLKKLSISDEHRNLMINKVKAIAFDGTTCSEYGGGLVSSLLIPNALYTSESNSFKVCAGFLLQSTSEFQIAESIAHELSHSIDPCNIALGPKDYGFKYSKTQDQEKIEQEYPIKNLIKCLRDPRSIGAKPKSQALTPEKTHFCNFDQIGESFADWMATEVIPVYIEKNHKLTIANYRNGYANVNRLNCSVEKNDSLRWDEHPLPADRINKILLVNPKVRAQMGCPEKHPDYVYCNPQPPLDAPKESSSQAK